MQRPNPIPENQKNENTKSGPVCSYNEWDPLEEVIVGRLENAMLPSWHTVTLATIPAEADALRENLLMMEGHSQPYPPEQIAAAQTELNTFIHILEAEGVRVRRPDVYDFSQPFQTPGWQVAGGFCSANPRDVLIVVGNEIIEAPMADRCRYFEMFAYRSLLKEYFAGGARWSAVPRPTLTDELYDTESAPQDENDEINFVTTEFEPAFDAADFTRCGRDIFVQRSHVTNYSGIEWMRRHLGDEFRVHEIKSRCKQAMHIDTTFVPLAPGKMMINPEFVAVDSIPAFVKKWDIIPAPEPVLNVDQKNSPVSCWMNMNTLMLDEERVIVEESQEPTIKALRALGFKPIPCPFSNYYPFGGSFHCATLDVRRRGGLQSYF